MLMPWGCVVLSFLIHSFSRFFLMSVSFLGALSIQVMAMWRAPCLGRLKCLATGVLRLCLASAQCSTSRHSRERLVSPTYCLSQAVQVIRYTTFSVGQLRYLRIVKVSPEDVLVKVTFSVVWEISLGCCLLLHDLHWPHVKEPLGEVE